MHLELRALTRLYHSTCQPQGPRLLPRHDRGVSAGAHRYHRGAQPPRHELGDDGRRGTDGAHQQLHQGPVRRLPATQPQERHRAKAGGWRQVSREESGGCHLRSLPTESTSQNRVNSGYRAKSFDPIVVISPLAPSILALLSHYFVKKTTSSFIMKTRMGALDSITVQVAARWPIQFVWSAIDPVTASASSS